MKKAILIVCVLALLVAASAAFAGDGSRVFLSFKAGWYNGTTTSANSTVSIGAAPTAGLTATTINSTSENLVATNGVSFWSAQKVAAAPSYTFTLLVAPGNDPSLTDHVGDAHEGMLYISAWNLELWSGTSGMTLPTNWQVTVTGDHMVGGSVTWTKDQLFRASAPASTAVAAAGFWYDYQNHYADFGTAYNAGETLTVTIGAAPPPDTPEPGSLLALGSGLMGLVGFAIRRRRA